MTSLCFFSNQLQGYETFLWVLSGYWIAINVSVFDLATGLAVRYSIALGAQGSGLAL
jgi:hypothetical protein